MSYFGGLGAFYGNAYAAGFFLFLDKIFYIRAALASPAFFYGSVGAGVSSSSGADPLNFSALDSTF